MIALNICKNLCRVRPRKFVGSHVSRSAAGIVLNGRSSVCADRPDSRLSGKPIFQQQRLYSAQTTVARLPPLSDEDPVSTPGFFKGPWNMFLVTMTAPSVDKEFDLPSFRKATIQAIHVVSKALANEDYEQLDDLVSSKIIPSLREKISQLNSEQKKLIAINKEDIHLWCPYNISVAEEDEAGETIKILEIMIVAHSLPGAQSMLEAGESLSAIIDKAYQTSVICNYGFARKITKDGSTPWMINMINEFSPDIEQ